MIPNQQLEHNPGWAKLIESTPATAAFPIGFRPRLVGRLRKEYSGKLFYLQYSIPGSKVNYSVLDPHWTKGADNQQFDMKYFDGGTFNREPHDLARAALMRYLQSKGKTLSKEAGLPILPNNGTDTFASVLLIDPFPQIAKPTEPGTPLKGIPTLLQQPALLLNAMVDEGRFHVDWIEKVTDEKYYSRFLISPKRPVVGHCKEEYKLAGGPFGAFCGFMDQSFRVHDYELGHYNTYQFLSESFMLPVANEVVDYCKAGTPQSTLDKYEALGWYKVEDEKDAHGKKTGNKVSFCQIIPRFEEPNDLNTKLPEWPQIDRARWESIKAAGVDRRWYLFRDLLEKHRVAKWLAWHFLLRSKVKKELDMMDKTLECAGLLK